MNGDPDTSSPPELPSKESVEASPFGSLSLSLVRIPSWWTEENRIDRLREAIERLYTSVKEEYDLILEPLRLVIITGAFQDEAARWQQQLNQPEGTSASAEGVAVAKTLNWGTEVPGVYSVIIMEEGLASGLLDQDPTATATFVHELAHVHNDLLVGHLLGPAPLPRNDDWDGIKRSIADNLWAEFFCEFVAYAYAEENWLDRSVGLSVDLLNGVQQRINGAIDKYWSDRDMGALLDQAMELGDVFNQLGRSLGLLHHAKLDGHDHQEQFFTKVEEVSPAWRAVVQDLSEELERQTHLTWEMTRFDGLTDIVERGYWAAGLRPVRLTHGLRVDVRPSVP